LKHQLDTVFQKIAKKIFFRVVNLLTKISITDILPYVQKDHFADQILLQIRRKRHLKNNHASKRNRKETENVPNCDDDKSAVVYLNMLVHNVATCVERYLVKILNVEVEIKEERQNRRILNKILESK